MVSYLNLHTRTSCNHVFFSSSFLLFFQGESTIRTTRVSANDDHDDYVHLTMDALSSMDPSSRLISSTVEHLESGYISMEEILRVGYVSCVCFSSCHCVRHKGMLCIKRYILDRICRCLSLHIDEQR
jgi:hypothetical protein